MRWLWKCVSLLFLAMLITTTGCGPGEQPEIPEDSPELREATKKEKQAVEQQESQQPDGSGEGDGDN